MNVAGSTSVVSAIEEQACAMCRFTLHTALHNGKGSNQKRPSPKQCDYQIKYTDNASWMGVLIADNFSSPLRNSSDVRPSLTIDYPPLCTARSLSLDPVLDAVMFSFVCTAVVMTSKWEKMAQCK
jgi:hypothetical protein